MRDRIGEDNAIERAISTFETTTGLRAELLRKEVAREREDARWRSDAIVEVSTNHDRFRFSVEVRKVDRFGTLEPLVATQERAGFPLLMVSPYVSGAIAERCRQMHVNFMDEAGNAYLEAPGLFVYATGRRRPAEERVAQGYRALTGAGMRVVFALLQYPTLVTAPYREIAGKAGVALGTVGKVLSDLESRGYLSPEDPAPRRLLMREKLLEEWAVHYPISLRSRLNARRFKAPEPGWWRDRNIGGHHACWGGEIAGEKLTGYLKPSRATVYVSGRPDKLILACRLRPDLDGDVEILEAFWPENEAGMSGEVVPPLVAYADLMATSDPRNIETAKLIRERYLS